MMFSSYTVQCTVYIKKKLLVILYALLYIIHVQLNKLAFTLEINTLITNIYHLLLPK